MRNYTPRAKLQGSPGHNRLKIQNLTVFSDFEIEFGPGLNVILGGNGTGKTHLLKVLYSIDKLRWKWSQLSKTDYQDSQIAATSPEMRKQLELNFLPENFSDLYRRGRVGCRFEAAWDDGVTVSINLENGRSDSAEYGLNRQFDSAVFIPSHDVLGHSLGFHSLYSKREIDFDQTFDDLLLASRLSPLREAESPSLLKIIERIIGGRVVSKGDRFYIEEPKSGHSTELHLVAEGWRKLALLHLLISNGSLGKGRILLWDEPEANLNPSYMDEVIRIILALARAGMQVILTTHDYVILKEIDLRATSRDSVAYFALEASKDGTIARVADDFATLTPNLILDQFDSLLMRDLSKNDSGLEEEAH